jgi:hypothetical protein
MKTIYQMLAEAKIAAMKNIFATVGSEFDQLAEILSDDELAKSFDYFSKRCLSTDDDEDDVALWIGYLEFAKGEFAYLDKVQKILENFN